MLFVCQNTVDDQTQNTQPINVRMKQILYSLKDLNHYIELYLDDKYNFKVPSNNQNATDGSTDNSKKVNSGKQNADELKVLNNTNVIDIIEYDKKDTNKNNNIQNEKISNETATQNTESETVIKPDTTTQNTESEVIKPENTQDTNINIENQQNSNQDTEDTDSSTSENKEDNTENEEKNVENTNKKPGIFARIWHSILNFFGFGKTKKDTEKTIQPDEQDNVIDDETDDNSNDENENSNNDHENKDTEDLV